MARDVGIDASLDPGRVGVLDEAGAVVRGTKVASEPEAPVRPPGSPPRRGRRPVG